MDFEHQFLALGLDFEAIAFIQRHMLSEVKWAMLRFLHEYPKLSKTRAAFAKLIGRSEQLIAPEIDHLITAGIVTANEAEDGTVIYSLTEDQTIRKTLDNIIELYKANRAFRRLLATHIMG
jgi:hypothetical protein